MKEGEGMADSQRTNLKRPPLASIGHSNGLQSPMQRRSRPSISDQENNLLSSLVNTVEWESNLERQAEQRSLQQGQEDRKAAGNSQGQ